MTVQALAEEFTQLCKDGRFDEAGEKFWSPDIVSLEPPGGSMARCEGLDAVRRKGEWWVQNHEVHSVKTEGPFVHGEQFAVIFEMAVTPKTGEMAGRRLEMREVGLYTVRGGKITEERFFYGE